MASVTISRHCVAVGEDGLSPLQRALQEDPSRIRIADAPTGAGKTYSFQRLVERGARVLFIVPTRRLADNIVSGVVEHLSGRYGWDATRAGRHVRLWSSRRTDELRARNVPPDEIRRQYVREIFSLLPGSLPGAGGVGQMVVSTPEMVGNLLHRKFLHPGKSDAGVLSFMMCFDHIVFDEFHSMDAGGFALAAVFARLAACDTGSGEIGYGNARVTFLSATRIEILDTLEALDVPVDRVSVLEETLVEEGRALHGDVRLTIEPGKTLIDLIAGHAGEIRREAGADRQTVVIYDMLKDLERDLVDLRGILDGVGVRPEEVLVINGARDRGRGEFVSCGFCCGQQDPDRFKVIVATSSVEMGMTFREANLMFMDPGLEPMNFMQRYGRAARRGADGAVYVTGGDASWVRDLSSWVEENDGERMTIRDLTLVVTRRIRERFAGSVAGCGGAPVYGSLSMYARWRAALYWQMLIEHGSNQGSGRREILWRNRPRICGVLAMKLKEVVSSGVDGAREWGEFFCRKALVLRDIEPRATVEEGNGNRIELPLSWIARHTGILQKAVRDEVTGILKIRGTLGHTLREKPDSRVHRVLRARFPHTRQVGTLNLRGYENRAEHVKRWVEMMKGIDKYAVMLDDEALAVCKAAEELVRLTGIIPGEDSDVPEDPVHAIL